MSSSATSPPSETLLKVGIVGFGPFAQFLSRTILKQGHLVTATSRSDHSQLCSELGITFFRYPHTFIIIYNIHVCITHLSIYSHHLHVMYFREMEKFCDAKNDVMLLCPSILSFSMVMQSFPFNRLEEGTLFVDVLSVKEYPRDLLLSVCSFNPFHGTPFHPHLSCCFAYSICVDDVVKVLPEECDVLCTHPMFGPESGKDGWNGLPLVFDKVRIRNEGLCRNFLSIFEKEVRR